MLQIKTNIGYVDAHEELIDTVIIADDGQEYIRTIDGVWEVYKEPSFEEIITTSRISNVNALFKNPKKRRRLPSKYNVFFKEYMKHISELYPDMNGKDRMKMVAKAWKNM